MKLEEFYCQKGGLFSFLAPLIKVGLPLIKHVITPLAKIVSIHLGLTAAAAATYEASQKKIFGSDTTTSIFSNGELNLS